MKSFKDYLENPKIDHLEEKMIESIDWHINNRTPLNECVYRVGSESYFAFWRTARKMVSEGKLEVRGLDKILIEETDIGKFDFYDGQPVPLDCPMFTEEIQETIRHEGEKWVIYSKDGSKKLGTYDTEKEAKKRLGQIEYFKHMNEEKDVELNKPKRGGSKKFYVYVRDPQTKNIRKVEWGDTSGLSVKINDPEARASFAARHKCSTRNDKTTPSYWACRTPRYAKQLGLSGGGNFFW